jgi:uncharacterized protein with NAD-binding domain and iron-sulfur cluster
MQFDVVIVGGGIAGLACVVVLRDTPARVATATSFVAKLCQRGRRKLWRPALQPSRANVRAALPPRCLACLLPEEWRRMQPFKALEKNFEPSPYVSCYLWFDRKLTRKKFWARIWNPNGLNTDFYDLSNIRRGWSGREASVMASNIIYSHRAEALSDEQIVARTVEEIEEAFPAAGRWQGTPRRLVLPKRAPQGIAGWVHGAG